MRIPAPVATMSFGCRLAPPTGRTNLSTSDSLAQIDEINRTSSVMIISAGYGYDQEDIIEAGTDVARSFLLTGPVTSKALLSMSQIVIVGCWASLQVYLLLAWQSCSVWFDSKRSVINRLKK